MMKLEIRHGREVRTLQFELSGSLASLRTAVREAFPQVPLAHQRIVVGSRVLAWNGASGRGDERTKLPDDTTPVAVWLQMDGSHRSLPTTVLRVTLFSTVAEDDNDDASKSGATHCGALRPPTVGGSSANDTAAMLSDDSEVYEWLSACSRFSCGPGAMLQPTFAFTYFVDAVRGGGGSDDASNLLMPVCGACAHACHGMRDVAILDNIAFLRQPFECQCHRILKSEHRCCWGSGAGMRPPSSADTALTLRLRAAWAEQARCFLGPILVDKHDALVRRMTAEEPQVTEQLRSAMSLFSQYYDAASQLEAIRCVPVTMLKARAAAALAEAHGHQTANGDEMEPTDASDELFKQLLFWFKDAFFKWVDNPTCACGATCSGRTDAGAPLVPTPEERANWSTSVEAYRCDACRNVTRFPRYNKAKRLLTWRQGRCGEWTNCFLLIAISLGYECRYVLDFTDHVWVEVYSAAKRRWVHADPCEKAFDTPLMYEEGWKKALSYVIAFSSEECVDVIRRYSMHPTCLSKRCRVSETFVNALVATLDGEHASGMRPDRIPLFTQRRQDERTQLMAQDERLRQRAQHVARGYGARTTGSSAWRSARGEAGVASLLDAATNVEDALPPWETELRQLYGWRSNVDLIRVCRKASSSIGNTASLRLLLRDLPSNVVVVAQGMRFNGCGTIASYGGLRVERGFDIRCTFGREQGVPLSAGAQAEPTSLSIRVGTLCTAIVSREEATNVLTMQLSVGQEGTFHGGMPPSPCVVHPLRNAFAPLPTAAADALGACDVDVQLSMDVMGGMVCHIASAAHGTRSLTLMAPLFGPPTRHAHLHVTGTNCLVTACSISGALE